MKKLNRVTFRLPRGRHEKDSGTSESGELCNDVGVMNLSLQHGVSGSPICSGKDLVDSGIYSAESDVDESDRHFVQQEALPDALLSVRNRLRCVDDSRARLEPFRCGNNVESQQLGQKLDEISAALCHLTKALDSIALKLEKGCVQQGPTPLLSNSCSCGSIGGLGSQEPARQTPVVVHEKLPFQKWATIDMEQVLCKLPLLHRGAHPFLAGLDAINVRLNMGEFKDLIYKSVGDDALSKLLLDSNLEQYKDTSRYDMDLYEVHRAPLHAALRRKYPTDPFYIIFDSLTDSENPKSYFLRMWQLWRDMTGMSNPKTSKKGWHMFRGHFQEALPKPVRKLLETVVSLRSVSTGIYIDHFVWAVDSVRKGQVAQRATDLEEVRKLVKLTLQSPQSVPPRRNRFSGCFRCGDLGHFARDCPLALTQNFPQQQGPFRQPVCDSQASLMQPVHVSQPQALPQLPLGPLQGSPPPCYLPKGACYQCGRFDHFWRQCNQAPIPSTTKTYVQYLGTESTRAKALVALLTR